MEMSDVISNQIYEIRLKAEETVDDFIFQTIQPFCENIVKLKVPKKELEDMLLRAERMKWTPCNKRLPEDGVDVLVWFEYFRYGDYNCMQKSYGISYAFDGSWSGFVNGSTGWRQMKILYWMPLPESPESEEK